MMNAKKSLVFFGSGPVAAESLRQLSTTFNIEAVVTKPTTKHEMASVVKDTDIYTASDKRELDDIFATKSFKSEVGLLIDFGIIVSNKVIDYFPKGIVNSHFSLLPELRGADPISFAILEGREETGVSLMLLVEAMDEGPLLCQSVIKIAENETSTSLTTRLIRQSSDDLIKTLPLYLANKLATQDQIESTVVNKEPTYTRKLNKSDGKIDWNKSAVQIEREVRAYIEWPKSRTTLGGVELIILKAHPVPNDYGGVGEVENSLIKDGVLAVQTGSGYLCIDVLKPAGKKEMTAKSFLARYRTRIGLKNQL